MTFRIVDRPNAKAFSDRELACLGELMESCDVAAREQLLYEFSRKVEGIRAKLGTSAERSLTLDRFKSGLRSKDQSSILLQKPVQPTTLLDLL